MFTELTQCIALIGYGNPWLHSDQQSITSLRSSLAGTVLEGAGVTKFLLAGAPVAASASEWFEYLRSIQAIRLRLVLGPFPDSVASVFRSAREWAVQVDLERGASVWKAWWEKAQGRGEPWRITYSGLFLAAPLPLTDLALSEAEGGLRSAIEAAKGFATKTGRDRFVELLARISTEPVDRQAGPDPFSGILPPASTNPEARRLLALADRAFIFGGMGSWNDFGSPDGALQREFLSVTSLLWRAFLTAVATATNALNVPPP